MTNPLYTANHDERRWGRRTRVTTPHLNPGLARPSRILSHIEILPKKPDLGEDDSFGFIVVNCSEADAKTLVRSEACQAMMLAQLRQAGHRVDAFDVCLTSPPPELDFIKWWEQDAAKAKADTDRMLFIAGFFLPRLQ